MVSDKSDCVIDGWVWEVLNELALDFLSDGELHFVSRSLLVQPKPRPSCRSQRRPSSLLATDIGHW